MAALSTPSQRPTVTPGPVLGPGALIEDRYRLLERIGLGGTGIVFRAVHVALETVVAIKFLRMDRPPPPALRARFLAEARAAARVRSPHVARVLDFGGEMRGQPFLVMEHVPGPTLEQRLARFGPLDPAHAAEVIDALAAGLDVVHRAGLVHRDVTPANVVLGDVSEGAKLIDFGLAWDPQHATDERTGPLGTLGFVSPAELAGAAPSREGDLWALAATAAAAVIGRSPFESDSPELAVLSAMGDEPPRLSELRPGLPADLDLWAEIAFAADESARFGSPMELAYAFKLAATARGPLASDSRPPSSP